MQMREVVDSRFPNLTYGDVLAHKFVTKEARRLDRHLFGYKWFDYRFMTPTEATMEFIDRYAEEARKIYARELDYEKAPLINFYTAKSILADLENPEARGRRTASQIHTKAKQSFAAFWRARCCADAIQMPYGPYVEHVMTYRMRSWNMSDWKRRAEEEDRERLIKGLKPLKRDIPKHMVLPLPAQLYGQIDVEKTAARWDELKKSRLFYASHYAYMPENWRGAPAQVDYAAYLVEQARMRPHADMILRDMIEHDRISPVALREQIGDREYQALIESRSH